MLNEESLIALVVYHRERNTAIGIGQDTQFVRGLSAFVRSVSTDGKKAVTYRFARAVWLQSLVDEYQLLAKHVTEHIMRNIDNQDTRNDGLQTMIGIDSAINAMVEELENMR